MFKLEEKNDLIDMWARGVDAWYGGSYAGEEPTHVEGAEPRGLWSRASARRESRGRGERAVHGTVVGPGDGRWVHQLR